MNQVVGGQSEGQRLVSQRSEDEMIMIQPQRVDIDKIYEFNDDEELNEVNDLNGFKLSGMNNKNSQSEGDYPYYSSGENEDWSSRGSDLCIPTLSSRVFNSNQEPMAKFQSYANLNDYVTLKIFKLLTLIELQQCRLTCKKWRILADQIKIPKLSLIHFSTKHSWSSDENFRNIQKYPDALDMKSLVSIEKILFKEQFKDLVELVLISDYLANATYTLNLKLLELDLSRFKKLKKVVLLGTMIYLKESQKCETLTHLTIEYPTVNLLAIFPNLVYLKTNVLTPGLITSSTLEQLEIFDSERDMSIIQSTLNEICPNIKKLSCYLLNAYSLLDAGNSSPANFQLKKLKTIQTFFNSFTAHEILIDCLVQAAKSLNIELQFHVNKNREKTDLLRWNKFFKQRHVNAYFYAGKQVNLRDFFLLPNYENNTLLKQNLKVDDLSLNQINDKIYQYLFNANSLEFNCSHLESKFNRLIRALPSVNKLTINCPLQQSTFDDFKTYCPFLSHLKISTNQTYKLNLNFIHYLDHLTSLRLINLDLTNTSGIANKVKFSKFLHVLEFKNCSLDADYCLIFEAMIKKAKKNQGKFYEITILSEQPDHKAKLNEQFKHAPQNFYSNIFRLI